MDVLNPATGEVIAEVPSCTAEDVNRAVAAAKKALPDWLDKTPKDRMELLLKLADVIEEHADELWQLESLNVGKPHWWVSTRRSSRTERSGEAIRSSCSSGSEPSVPARTNPPVQATFLNSGASERRRRRDQIGEA